MGHTEANQAKLANEANMANEANPEKLLWPWDTVTVDLSCSCFLWGGGVVT